MRFLVSRPTGRWDLRSRVCPFVRTSVRSYATLFLGNRSLLFYETLQLGLVGARKMFQALFFHRFGHFGQKLSKMALFGQKWPKWRFLAFFSRTVHQNFIIFCFKHSLWILKIITFSLLVEISKMALFGENWPKFDLNLADLAGFWNSWKSQKNQRVGVFETNFKQVPFVFRQTTCTYSESWRPVENVCDPIPPPRGGGEEFGEKMTEKIFSGQKFFSLNFA